MMRLILGIDFALPAHCLCRASQRVEGVTGQTGIGDGEELFGGRSSLGVISVVGAGRRPDVVCVAVDDLLAHSGFSLRGVTGRAAREKRDCWDEGSDEFHGILRISVSP